MTLSLDTARARTRLNEKVSGRRSNSEGLLRVTVNTSFIENYSSDIDLCVRQTFSLLHNLQMCQIPEFLKKPIAPFLVQIEPE